MGMVSRYSRILSKLREEWPQATINLYDESLQHITHREGNSLGESHFILSLKGDEFPLKERIQLHRKIYSLLAEEFQTGLHALSIKVESHD